MNKVLKYLCMFISCFMILIGCFTNVSNEAFASDTNKTYFTVYDSDKKEKVLFYKGEDVNDGDKYLSSNNKLYEITQVDEKNKTAIAKFIKDEELPKYNVTSNYSSSSAKAATTKKVGVYHTHNDESYFTPDGVDSVYGAGGIHDVGKAFVSNLQKLNIQAIYREDLHLPHNSGAYTRSQVTAAALLNEGVDGIFDLHRDSTKRDYYLTKVNGKQMSSVRMVIGASSANYEENKKFAYAIKGYADSAYPGLIKDIYIGKGNYNQQLSTRAMLFEMGCENIEKDYAITATEYLAKVVDVVLYGSDNASEKSLSDVSLNSDNGEASAITGLVNDSSATNGGVNSNQTLYVVLGILGVVLVTFVIVMICSKTARYKVGRFFSETFAGLFGKKKKI